KPPARNLSRKALASASLLSAASCTAQPPALDADALDAAAGAAAWGADAVRSRVGRTPCTFWPIFRRAASAAVRVSNGPAATWVNCLPPSVTACAVLG